MQNNRPSVYDFITEGTPEDVKRRYAVLNERAQLADFGELDRNVVVIDTETTGVSEKKDELTQIAAARLECGEIREWFVTFVNPGRPIPDEIVHLTHITEDDVAFAPTPEEACAQLAEFAGDATLVAHNAAFDRHFVTRPESGRVLRENLWVDSLDLARIALPRLKSHRLIDLVKAFDAPVSTHRADADVAALCAVYRILLAAVASMPLDLVEYIANLASVEDWQTGAVFSHMARYIKATEGPRRSAAGRPVTEHPFSLSAMRRARVTPMQRDEADRIAERRAASANAGAGPLYNVAGADGASEEDYPSVPLEFPSIGEVDAAFSADGVIGGLYEGFECRPEQQIMAEEVTKAFSTSTNLAIEAGTGVGKSMAYLYPGAVVALRNGVRFGVATKTNALLDQIVYKELPLLAQGLAEAGEGELTYAALKGFSHYPCLYRVDKLVRDGAHNVTVAGKEVSQAPAIAALLSFIEQTGYDDMDGLKLDYRALPRYAMCTSSRECLRRKCPFFTSGCFVHGLRRRAEGVDVVVTNHTLLFLDVAADGNLLPPTRLWVVDEAHGAEAEARRALSVQLDAAEMMRLANRLASQDARRNPFVRTAHRGPFDGEGQPEASTLFYGLVEKARAHGEMLAASMTEFVHHMKDLVGCEPGKANKSYETFDLWISDEVRRDARFVGLAGFAKQFRSDADRLLNSATELVGYLEGVDGAADCQREVASVVIDVKDMYQASELILGEADARYVYSAKLSRKPERVAEVLSASLVNVGDELNATLYEHTDSVVYASATLTVAESFAAFKAGVGLDVGESSRANTCQLGSSYDFDEAMQVLVINDIPEPNAPGYLAALEELLVGVHIAQQGSMLTLFTNRRDMESCFDAVNPALKAKGLRLVCQKWGVSTKGLQDDFLADEHLSLFALKSFWEGFDAPGATLKGVIIPKLPFAKPTDPLSCERAARDSAAWSHYTLPQAVIELKQAAGRLIRTANDTGTLILADRRLITKGYGRTFLKSLPSRSIRTCSTAQAVAYVESLKR